MIDDPIVREIRQIRRAYAESLNNDLHAICEDLRRQERESDREFGSPTDWHDRNTRQQQSAVTNQSS